MLNLKSKRVDGLKVSDLTRWLSMIILMLAVTSGHTETYTYDDAGRLTGVTYDDNTTITYSYDSAGNILQQTTGVNNLPEDFALVFPADAATGLPTSIPLIWKTTTDPDGDTVSYRVNYCDNVDFTGCTAQTVASIIQPMNFYASIAMPVSGLFILGFVFTGGTNSRLKKPLTTMAIIAFVSGLVACGGGGGGSSDDPDLPTAAADERQLDITGLVSATTYYWRVTADDGNGGLTESAINSFTTQ